MHERLITTASAPGRVCLGGESLDWMIKGPSVVGAIDLRIRTVVTSNSEPDEYHLQAAQPLNEELRIKSINLGKYTTSKLNFVHAAIKVLADQGLPLRPFKLETFTELPTSAGVSSSAAVSLATIAAVSSHFDQNKSSLEICADAYQVEKNELKTGAGQMDFYACGLGMLHYLNCMSEPPNPLEQSLVPKDVKLILVDTRSSHITSNFIAQKRKRFNDRELLIMEYVKNVEKIVEHLRLLLPNFDSNAEEIGYYVTLCHQYLRDKVKSSTDLLDECVETCLKQGALGAKLTGSGMGGCMFALASENKVEAITHALSSLPVNIHITSFSETGIKIENYA